MNELTLTPLGAIPQTTPGQTVYVSLTPFAIPWWAWAIGAGIAGYALMGKKKTRTIWRGTRKRRPIIRKTVVKKEK
jgi:hypothetical protein